MSAIQDFKEKVEADLEESREEIKTMKKRQIVINASLIIAVILLSWGMWWIVQQLDKVVK